MATIQYYLRKTLQLLMAMLSGLLFLVILYFTSAIFLSFLPSHPPGRQCKPGNQVYLNTNGVHVDFIIPAHAINPLFREQLNVLPGTRYIAFGWGDRNFYINTPYWSDLTFPVAFRALFLKSSTAMHVTFYHAGADSWKMLLLCDEQMAALIDYIINAFETDKFGDLVKMDFEGYNSYDAFFEAKGSFSLFKTCNGWVNRGLKEAGVRTAIWTPFDFGVLYHIR